MCLRRYNRITVLNEYIRIITVLAFRQSILSMKNSGMQLLELIYMSEFKGKCPRCGSTDAVDLGNPTIHVGKTRQARVNVRECANCKLIYYEAYTE